MTIYLQENRSIRHKITFAEKVLAKHKENLLSDQEFYKKLESYKQEIERSWEIMRASGLTACCSLCGSRPPGGGCCGKGIEEWYDEYLILLNLLMEVPIQKERQDDTWCLFLSPTGCTLKARHHFCVNYICLNLQKMIDKDKLQLLSSQSGQELFLSWELEKILRSRVLS